MKNKEIFGEDTLNYDLYRPTYHPELFQDIFDFVDSDYSETLQAIEIGPGTGLATTPFLRKSIQLEAIEISQKMAVFLRNKFKDFTNFHVINAAFEESSFASDSIDLLYSATAFHWISKEKSYQKIYNILKPSGSIALFWNIPSIEENGSLYQRIQAIYDTYQNNSTAKVSDQTATRADYYERIIGDLEPYGFSPFIQKTYSSIRNMNSSQYINLLNTYSDHRSMEPEHKLLFEQEIKEQIRLADDNIRIVDTNLLFLSKKINP